MNIYKELEELDNMQNKLKTHQDTLLDHYKKNPSKCEKLLIELNELNRELEELELEFIDLLK
jgi:hypothetical protein